MRIWILVALLLTAMPVAAQHWVKVGENAGDVTYIDADTIRINGHLRRVWQLHDLKKREPETGYMSRLALYEYDCKQHTLRVLSLSGHSDPMAQGQVLFTGDDLSRWINIPPGS